MKSLWLNSIPHSERPSLQSNETADVAVIGAGLAGILTGYLLQEAGLRVIILEANQIASGQTGFTTAKITSQHGLIYHRLLQSLGPQQARLYAQANEEAIRDYRRLIETEQIDCDFENQAAYLYSQQSSLLKQEWDAAYQLGLPASLVFDPPLPIQAAAALRFDNQAQFNPAQFVRHLAQKLMIYEHSKVLTVSDHRVRTGDGSVQADHIVFACHFPFINFPGYYFARMHQSRSYVLALENAEFPSGMWLGADAPSYSFRHYGKYLLFGGEGHRTGQDGSARHYQALREAAKRLFPQSQEAAHWSAQDCMPVRPVPYIGRFSSNRPHWYAATGFQKWGMTSSMIAARLITSQICQIDSPYSSLYDPRHLALSDIPRIASEGVLALKSIGRRIFQPGRASVDAIQPGEGGIAVFHGKKVGAYRDPEGKLFIVDIRCPHLGCELSWNPDELSWDCPCHGSRFDYRGQLICDPAQTSISKSVSDQS